MIVNVEFDVEVKNKPHDKWYHCRIPSCDIYFSSKNKKHIPKIASAAIKSFINHWNKYNGGTHEGALKFWNDDFSINNNK